MDSSLGLQFGLVQYLGRLSGDSPAAMMVLTALLMPLFQNSHRIFQWLLQKIGAHLGGIRADTARRVIEFTDGENMSLQAPGPFQEETATERNNILQKAIRLYINRGKLQINDAELYLLSTPRGARSDDHRHPSLRPPRKAGDMDRALEKLMGYSVVRGPREDRWLLVDPERAVHFKFYSSTSRSCDEEDCGKGSGKGKGGGMQGGSRTTTTFELKATGRGAEQRLDAFVEEALKHYKDLKASAIDRSRYFIMPTFPTKSKSPCDDEYDYMKGYGKGRQGATPCKRYLLSEHKTFGSLFFSEKPQVISMLDDFMGGRGKFAIDGFPNKLGLLLHGPPGTGKTSLIKSIASYTKRHIVEVPLSKVTTNKVLFDTMFDLVFAVTGEDEALRMNFNDIVFVMEDVDAASDVVYARSPQEGKTSKVPAVSIGSPSGHSADVGAGPRGSAKGDDGEEVEHKEDDDKDSEDEEERLGKGSGKGFGKGKWGMSPAAKAGKGKEQEDPDKLNLAGLLNVLDGVVDSPGRILIMTTNHPEKLDPALIRPGRINFAVELGYLRAGPLCDLIQHVMAQEMTAAQRKVAAALAEQRELTPAQVEQTCTEVSSVEELLQRLSRR